MMAESPTLLRRSGGGERGEVPVPQAGPLGGGLGAGRAAVRQAGAGFGPG